MDTDRHRLEFENETRQIIGCAVEVLNTIGHGLQEKPYENALVVVWSKGNIVQPATAIRCDLQERQGGEYIPDLIAFDEIVVDTKVIEKIADLEIGLILNFKRPKLEWKRIVL